MPPERPLQAHACFAMLALVSLLAVAAPTSALSIDPFDAACPATLDGEANGNVTVTLRVDASSEVALHRGHGNGSERIAVLNGSGTYLDADVDASTTYDYHVTLVVGGEESPPCDRIQVTTGSDVQVGGDARGDASAGNASGDGGGNSSADASASASAHTSAHAVLAACPATIHAEALGDGNVHVTVNTSMDVDAVVIQRSEGDGAVNETVLVESRSHVDAAIDTGAAYTYDVSVIVDGERSEVCDSVELTQMPLLPGAGAGLAITGAAVLGYIGWRRLR